MEKVAQEEAPQEEGVRTAPRHRRIFSELERRGIPTPDIVFDVGANVGQSLHGFRRQWPDAKLYGFEPVSATFKILDQNYGTARNCMVNHMALGRADGIAQMISKGTSTGNRIVAVGGKLRRDTKRPTEQVTVRSGDSFCKEHRISKIDFMKIDAEGHDLEVLAGFSDMLTRGAISTIQVEVSVHPGMWKSRTLYDVVDFMMPFGYHLLTVQNFMPRRGGGALAAYYADAIFIYEPFAVSSDIAGEMKRAGRAKEGAVRADGRDAPASSPQASTPPRTSTPPRQAPLARLFGLVTRPRA